MHRFFIDRNEIKDGEVMLTGDEAHHLTRVLRLETNDAVELLDGVGGRYAADIADISGKNVTIKILKLLPDNEPTTRVTLYQGIPKLDKLDEIIQKCVEIGVSEIMPVIFTRCVSKPDGAKAKLERYRRIAREATKQCARAYVPIINEPVSFNSALEHMKSKSCVIFPWEDADTGDIRNVPFPESRDIGLIIGPEGGITPQEAEAIASIPNTYTVTLGPRILRTETAGPAALAMILSLMGDMGDTGDMGGEPARERRSTP